MNIKQDSENEITENDVRTDPDNIYLTIPRSYGVWELSVSLSGKKYRYGNNPIRGKELIRDYGYAKLIKLYLDRRSAKLKADELNKL